MSLAPGFPSTSTASSPPLTFSGFSNGMLEVFDPEALNYFTFFRPILLTLSISRNPNLTHLPLSGFLDSLLCALIAPTPGLAFSLLMPRTLVAVSSFSSSRAFSKFSTSTLFSLDPYSDYVGINISPNNSSSLPFLNVYAPLISFSLTDGRTDTFSPSILSSSRNLFILGDFNCHHPLWDSKGTSAPCGEGVFDWVISSNLLPFNDPDTPTLLHRSTGSRSSVDISFAPSSLALSCLGRCFMTWVLTTYQFFYLFLSPRSFVATSVPIPSTFRKLAEMTLLPTLTPTIIQQRNTRLFLFPLLLFSLPLWH